MPHEHTWPVFSGGTGIHLFLPNPVKPIALPLYPDQPVENAGDVQAYCESLQHLLELASLGCQLFDKSGYVIPANQAWLGRPDCAGDEVKPAESAMRGKGELIVPVSFDKKIAGGHAGYCFQQIHSLLREISGQKHLADYLEAGREILQILNGLETLPEYIRRMLAMLQHPAGFDAVGIHRQERSAFPSYVRKGFFYTLLATEHSLPGHSGQSVRYPAEHADPAHPLGIQGGNSRAKESLLLLDFPPVQDASSPKSRCVRGGCTSLAPPSIRIKKKNVGSVHFDTARKGRFSLNPVDVFKDITPPIDEELWREQTESQLEEEKIRLVDIVDSLPDATFAIDRQGRIIIWNKAIEKMTGLSTADMVGKGNHAYALPFHGRPHSQLVDMVLKNCISIESLPQNIVREDQTLVAELFCDALYQDDGGAWILVKASPLYGQSGRIIGVIASIQDITARKFTEEKLKKSVAWFKALLNATSDSVILINTNGTILDLNENAALRRSLPADALRGKNLFACLPPSIAKMRRQAINRVLHERRLVEYEEYRQGKHYSVQLYPIMDDLGQVIQLAGFSRDITEIKKTEKEKDKLQTLIMQSRKMDAIGTLVRGIAHNFNNMLGAILGYTELAQDHIVAGSPAFKHLERVQEAGERAGALVKQILAFSRQTDAKRIPVRPSHVVREAVELLRPSLPDTISIELELEDAVRPIFANPTQVHQILINLCTNAFHAMEHAGGILKLVLKNRELSASDLQYRPEIAPGRFVELTVIDTGCGILPEIREKIFDPYFTTREIGQGTGMGLAIVLGIVTSHNGLITCESEVGKGTVFRVYFPVAEHMTCNAATIETVPAGTERVLFVDDEEMLVELGVLMLERLGYKVTGRTNSLEALETFRNQPDAFDAVIIDHSMPGITGSDLALRILRMRSDVPIILCTGCSNLISEEKARLLGIRGFAMKPLAQKDIGLLLRKLLDEAAPGH